MNSKAKKSKYSTEIPGKCMIEGSGKSKSGKSGNWSIGLVNF